MHVVTANEIFYYFLYSAFYSANVKEALFKIHMTQYEQIHYRSLQFKNTSIRVAQKLVHFSTSLYVILPISINMFDFLTLSAVSLYFDIIK